MSQQETDNWRPLTAEEWARLAPLFTGQSRPNRQQITDEQMVNAILYRHPTNAFWHEVADRFGSWAALTQRYKRWRDNGTLQIILAELEQMGLLTTAIEPPPQEDPQPEPLEWWELTDEQWEAVTDLFPLDPKEVYTGSRYKPNRQMLNALLYQEYTKATLRELPPQFGHWRTINSRDKQWRKDGTLHRVFSKLRELGVLSADKYSRGQGTDQGEEASLEWWELTDEQWDHIAPLVPLEPVRHGKMPKPNRQMLNAILCRYKTDTAWRDLPEKYGHWRTVNDRYTKWRDDGTLQRIMDELQKMDTPII